MSLIMVRHIYPPSWTQQERLVHQDDASPYKRICSTQGRPCYLHACPQYLIRTSPCLTSSMPLPTTQARPTTSPSARWTGWDSPLLFAIPIPGCRSSLDYSIPLLFRGMGNRWVPALRVCAFQPSDSLSRSPAQPSGAGVFMPIHLCMLLRCSISLELTGTHRRCGETCAGRG